MKPTITLFVSVDTEEDNWRPNWGDVTIENVRHLPELDAHFRRIGVRPTYFVTYQVANRRWAADLLQEIARDGRSEIGAHLHPWNTPPTPEAPIPINTMANNLPFDLVLQKLKTLTQAVRQIGGASPTSFRAGRYGLGPGLVRALIHCGYRVDSSVTPFMDWRDTDDGPNHEHAPLGPYRIDGSRDLYRARPDGRLLEIPLSFGYSRRPFATWHRVHRALGSRHLQRLRLLGLARRTGLIRKIALNPELSPPSDLLRLSKRTIQSGARHLHLFFHSPSLRPGATPYTQTASDVRRLLDGIARYVEELARLADVRPSTLSEAVAPAERRAELAAPGPRG